MSKDVGKPLQDVKKGGEKNVVQATKDVGNHGGGAKKGIEGC
jgi:hypothetical protein